MNWLHLIKSVVNRLGDGKWFDYFDGVLSQDLLRNGHVTGNGVTSAVD